MCISFFVKEYMKVNEQVFGFVGVWLDENESSSTKYFTEKIAQERLMFACLYFNLVGCGRSFKITNV